MIEYVDVFMKALAATGGGATAKKIVDDAYPEVKKLGKAGVDALRVLYKAGYGRDQIAVMYDDLATFLSRAARHVPPANQIPPPPQILIPILEQLRYEPIDTPVAEMLEAILARSMDKDRIFDAHPAFIQIVRGLVADEVRLLRHIYRTPLVTPWVTERTDKPIGPPPVAPVGLLEAPDALPLYLSHLGSHDLCITSEEVQGLYTPSPEGGLQVERRLKLILLPLGEHLMRAADLTSPAAPTDEGTAAG